MTKVRAARPGYAQSRIGHSRRKLLNEHVVPQPQIDEPRPGDCGGWQRSATSSGPDLGGHVARRAAQQFAQRHGEVRLVVAELRVLTAANLVEILVGRSVKPASAL